MQVLKTLIEKTEDLKPGDVLFVYEKGQEKKHPTWPRCNFLRIQVVTTVHQLEDGEYRYDFRKAEILKSSNGDHLIVQAALDANIVLDGGTFGCNLRVDGRHENFRSDTYRLDAITNHNYPVYTMPNLKGNPAYDLMM